MFLLIVAEATQQALIGNDMSITNCYLVMATLLAMDILFSVLKLKSRRIG